jgi:hypothetical protein
MSLRFLGVAAGLLLLALSCQAAPGEAGLVSPFLESWNNVSYYGTNTERQGFSSVLGQFQGKVGLNLFGLPLQAYGAYYCTAAQSSDYWNNNVFYGPGLRFRPLAGYEAKGWLDAWLPDLKIFVESLSASYLKDAASGEANKRTDLRYGLDLWHEWNLDKPDYDQFWGELWSNFSYRSTNFSWTDFNGYLFYFQPKLGRHLGRGVEAYLRADLTASDKTDYWLNKADYGVGLRFEPWRSAFKTDEDSFLKKFKMFAEVLGVSYLKDKPADPQKTVASDVRFGIDFSYGR